MAATNSWEAGRAMRDGALAGLAAGVLLSVYLAVSATIKGLDVWASAFKGAAAPLLGTEVTSQPGFDAQPVLLGALCHLAVSAIWGVLFALLAYGMSRAMTMVFSAVWGVVVWVGMFYVVLPIVGLGDMARGAPIGSAILSHVFFGLALGATYLPMQRPRTRATPAHRHHAGAPLHHH
jgi:hypothetical protein